MSTKWGRDPLLSSKRSYATLLCTRPAFIPSSRQCSSLHPPPLSLSLCGMNMCCLLSFAPLLSHERGTMMMFQSGSLSLSRSLSLDRDSTQQSPKSVPPSSFAKMSCPISWRAATYFRVAPAKVMRGSSCNARAAAALSDTLMS